MVDFWKHCAPLVIQTFFYTWDYFLVCLIIYSISFAMIWDNVYVPIVAMAYQIHTFACLDTGEHET